MAWSAAATRAAGSEPTSRVSATPTLRATRDTDATSDVDRRTEGLGDAGRERERVLRIRFVHDHELVASVAGDDIGTAQVPAQPVRGLTQHHISRVVTVAVVHGLEVVEVEERQRERIAGAFGAPEGLLEQLVEEPAVGQTGERIATGRIRQSGLDGAQLGDVPAGSLQSGGRLRHL